MTFLQKVLANNSPATLLLILVGAGVWLIGGNMLVARHYRRVGKSPWSGFKPFAFPLGDFNTREWCMFLLLGGISFILLTAALVVSYIDRTH